MQKFFWVLLLLLTSAVAFADTELQHEVQTLSAENETELVERIQALRESIQTTHHADLKPEILILEDTQPNEELTKIAKQISDQASIERHAVSEPLKKTLRQHFKQWFTKNYRITFTLIRGIANASVVSWGLMISPEIPPEAAVPVGLAAGFMSASFQYNNQKMQQWLVGNGSRPLQWIKNFLVGVGYLSVVKAVSYFSGLPHDPSLETALTHILATAFIGNIAQGSYSLSNAEYELLALDKNPEKAAQIKVFNDLRTLLISMVGTGISVAKLIGIPIAEIGMYTMGATGLATYSWVLMQSRKWKKIKQKQAGKECEKLLLDAFQIDLPLERSYS